jgi:peptide/nickel transport system substrate-binding protein
MLIRPCNRRRALSTFIALSTLLALAACSDDGGESSESAGNSDELRVVLAAQPPTLDPISGGRTAGQVVWGTMLEPLVTMDDDLGLTDRGLVTALERKDPNTWELTVREGVSFSNGEPADASAVAKTIELTRDADTSVLKQYFGGVERVETPDATTVVLRTSTPRFDIPQLLTTVFLVPPDYYEEEGTEGFNAAPVGTGPYEFESAKAGRSITVVRNPDYWGEPAKTEKITFSWAPEPSQRLALLQSGEQDVAFNLTTTQAEKAEAADLDVTRVESAMTVVAFLQADKAPLDDPKIREAIALSINRDEIVDGVLQGGGVPNGGMLNILPGQEPAQELDADPDRAKDLLAGTDVKVPLTYPIGQYPQIDDVAKAIGNALEQSGLSVKYNPVDYGSLVSQMINREITGIYLIGTLANAPMPDFIASGFFKSTALSGNCPVPGIDDLIAQALETEDAAASAPIYDELNTKAIVENHCFVPLYRLVNTYATQPGVTGVVYTPLNTMDFRDVVVP